ncbi:hypothetical protein D505_09958 [Elizabethkingia anophelis R26]|uniref:Uncharacterized protein n=1 Tax=Elizabethkingia anophelis R26 TaxID=1246994 RepID=A0ABM6MRS7_9FLAO|nr:hypothetical protein BAZ09_006020 [Elizabethkingia anophelis R26]ATC39438.1 hypothetical protein EAAG1_006020 [Elizabethkingia anophelis Ag1]ATC43117.1 hypothetical protein CMV41_06020 [Elizabethkingia anophelis]ATC46793.1 hypothetical protein CMV40_06020 [Elizabethkingia anophelis]ELR79492.1 hypothetical protein D505_09958 [Elizabethkingia anophelis R26]
MHEFVIILLVTVALVNTYCILSRWLAKPFGYPMEGVYYVTLATVLSFVCYEIITIVQYLETEFIFFVKIIISIIIWIIIYLVSRRAWKIRINRIHDNSDLKKSNRTKTFNDL